jgi:hypothetical protein
MLRVEGRMFTYDEIATSGILDTGYKKVDITLAHDRTIGSGDVRISRSLVVRHGG